MATHRKRTRKKATRKRRRSKRQPLRRRAKRLIFKNLKFREVVGAIGSYLKSLRHDPVLSGGACAAMLTRTRTPKTNSIEFAVRGFNLEKIASEMKKIGFRMKDEHTFSNRACPYEVVLIPSPVVVGDDAIIDSKLMKARSGVIKLLTPTDCVRQRLSHYYRCGEREALEEAVSVAHHYTIDLNTVERWSNWEWSGDKFRKFLELISKPSRKRNAGFSSETRRVSKKS